MKTGFWPPEHSLARLPGSRSDDGEPLASGRVGRVEAGSPGGVSTHMPPSALRGRAAQLLKELPKCRPTSEPERNGAVVVTPSVVVTPNQIGI